MFSADLDESLNNLEREKTLNDIVIRIKANSLNHELNKTVDPKRMQEIIIEQQKLNQIHIKL
jgi:DNA primase